MTNPVLFIARTSTTLWRRELAATFGMRERALTTALAVFGVVMIAFSVFLAWVLAEFLSSVIPAATYSADQRALLRLVFAGLILGTTVYFLVLCATLPPRDRLATMLSLLPVHRRQAQAGTLLPVFVVGTGIAFVFGLPAFPMIVKLVDVQRFTPQSVAAFVGTVALVALLVPGLFFTLRDLCMRTVRLPLAYSLGIAATSTVLILLAAVGTDLIPAGSVPAESAWSLLLPARAIAEVLQPASSDPLRLGVAWSGIALWFALAALLMTRVVLRSTPVEDRPFAAPTIRLPRHGSARLAAFMFEVVVLTRLPQFVVTAMILALASVVIPLVYTQPIAQSATAQVATLPVVAAAAIGAYSYGATRRSHWVGATVRRTGTWIWAKPFATLAVSSALAAPYLLLMGLAGLPADRFLDTATLGVSMWASAVVAGVLVPFVTDQPLSATVTSATTIALWVLSTFGLRWAFTSAQVPGPVVPALCWVATALIVYVVVATSAGTRNHVAAHA